MIYFPSIDGFCQGNGFFSHCLRHSTIAKKTKKYLFIHFMIYDPLFRRRNVSVEPFGSSGSAESDILSETTLNA